MTYRVHLHHQMIKCPPVWFNFIDTLPSPPGYEDIPIPMINSHLSKFNGRFLEEGSTAYCGGQSYIEFDSEHDYLLFLLKYM